MRVVLVNPASPQLINPMVMPPLGLWYLGAVLKAQGAEVIYHDANVDGPFPEADVYGVTGVSPQAVSMRGIIKSLRAEGKYIVAGGPHATLFPKVVEGWGADCVVVGEGEEVIVPIVQSKRKGIIRAERIKGLDGLPFPDRADAGRYTYMLEDRLASTMMTSRGCPYSCAFCCSALWGHRLIERSPANVLAEAQQVKGLGYRAIMFYDDTFTIKYERVKAIAEGLKALDLGWRCFIRANTVDEEMIRAMAENGCEEIGLGVETGSARILKTIDKKASILQNARAINLCRKHGISVKAFVIIGLPGETPETVEETLDFLRRFPPHRLDVVVYMPMPKTPITDNPERYDISWNGMLRPERLWYKTIPGEYEAIARTSAMTSEEIVAARDYIAREMNLPY